MYKPYIETPFSLKIFLKDKCKTKIQTIKISF